ncbi:MAG: Npt1/Npt2 family nucleotide transporter [Candidatus Desulfacyla sp.]
MNGSKRWGAGFFSAVEEKKGVFLPIFGCFFLILFSYSFIRPVCESLFLSSWGASKMPHVWIISAAATAAVVWVYNKFVGSNRPYRLYAASNFIAIAFFLLFYVYFSAKNRGFALTAFIVKDIYVVILIEQLWSFCDATFSENEGKTLYGFLAGACSIGGIAASVLTVNLASVLGSNNLLFVGCGALLAGVSLFGYANKKGAETLNRAQLDDGGNRSKDRPLEKGAEGHRKKEKRTVIWGGLDVVFKSKYLILICIMLMSSQFVTALIGLQFNQVLEVQVTELDLRTAYLAKFYGATNVISLILQFVVSAPILHFLGLLLSLLLVPAIMGAGSFAFFFLPTMTVLFGTRVANKSLTYSLFRAAKEILYIPLTYIEKYKGKAVIDMFIYRFAKGGIGVVIIGFQAVMPVTPFTINYMIIALILIWMLMVPLLIAEYKGRELAGSPG